MLAFERIHLTPADWAGVLVQFQDCPVPERSWLAFLEESQKGESIIAVLREDNVVLGYFAGLLIAKCGLSILGSQYMGFMLEPELPRADALDALQRFGFRGLHRTLKPTGDSYVEQDQL